MANLANVSYEIHSEFGDCKGIALSLRGPDDPHICFTILTEDDGNWHVSSGRSSAYWLADLEEVMGRINTWLEQHADKDPYGWSYPNMPETSPV